jgi:hypothetical protein
MGKYNSSTTRVVPVFDQMFDSDSTGEAWVPYLFNLGSRNRDLIPNDVGRLISGHERWWGENERSLPAPRGLLEWLVRNVSEDAILKSPGKGTVRDKRLRLPRGDRNAIDSALTAINSGRIVREWYVLEGPSRPDAYVETDRAILVVEGERTERACTTKTTFMPQRSQLLRHMDAALESSAKPVFGLLIVEGNSPNPSIPNAHWRSELDKQLEPKMVAGSLPHRDPATRDRIVDRVLGVATWSRICADLSLSLPADGAV